MASEDAERSTISQAISRMDGLQSDFGGVRVYSEFELAQSLQNMGMTEDELVNLNLCNNFLLLQLADFFEIPRQIMSTAMSLCQRYCIQSSGIFDRFAIVVGSFHLALKNHSFLLHIKEITQVALRLEYAEDSGWYVMPEMFKKVRQKIEQTQLDILKANQYNSNSSAYHQVKVTMCLLTNKGIWHYNAQEMKDFMDTANRLLLWSYGSKVVLMLSQNQLALLIICMTYKGMDLPTPDYRGVPIWYYAGFSKDQMLLYVTQLVQFYKINWTVAEADEFDCDGFLQVMADEIERFQEPGSETRVDGAGEEQWNTAIQQTSETAQVVADVDPDGLNLTTTENGVVDNVNADFGAGSAAGGQAVEEGEIADQ